MNNSSESVGSLTSALAGGTILLTGDLTVGNDNTTNGNYSGVIQGLFDVHKVGTGTQILSGDSGNPAVGGVMDGRFFVDAGTLNVTFANTASVSSKNPLGAALVTVANNATLQVSGATGYAGGVAGTAGAIPLQSITIQGTGAGGTGALRKTGNNATNLGGSIKLAGADGTDIRIQSENTSSTFTLSGNLSPFSAGTNHNLIVSQATGGSTTISGTLGLGTGTLTKEGGGILNLSGNNIGPWSGKIIVNGGTLSWSSDNGFTNHLGAAPASFTPDYVIVNGGTLRDTTSDTSGTSFMRAGRGIQVGPNGLTIDMSSTGVGAKAIYGSGDVASPATIGTGGIIGLTTGTTAATVTKIGAGEFRTGYRHRVLCFHKIGSQSRALPRR